MAGGVGTPRPIRDFLPAPPPVLPPIPGGKRLNPWENRICKNESRISTENPKVRSLGKEKLFSAKLFLLHPARFPSGAWPRSNTSIFFPTEAAQS